VARDDRDPTIRALAVQSATALFRKSALGVEGTPAPARVPAAIEGLRKTWTVAEDPAARGAVSAALRGLKDPRAIAAADELEQQATRAK
jgi:hypothetical protein